MSLPLPPEPQPPLVAAKNTSSSPTAQAATKTNRRLLCLLPSPDNRRRSLVEGRMGDQGRMVRSNLQVLGSVADRLARHTRHRCCWPLSISSHCVATVSCRVRDHEQGGAEAGWVEARRVALVLFSLLRCLRAHLVTAMFGADQRVLCVWLCVCLGWRCQAKETARAADSPAATTSRPAARSNKQKNTLLESPVDKT